MKLAEFTNALEAKEINDEKFVCSERGKNSRPNKGRVFAADWFAALCSEQFEADGFDIGAEVPLLRQGLNAINYMSRVVTYDGLTQP